MCNEAVRNILCMLLFHPDHLQTQEMCNEIMRTMPDAFHSIPDRFKTQEICDKAVKKTLLPCSLYLIGLLQGSGCVCDMMTIMMIMVVIGMMMKMKIIFLSGTMVIKNKRFKKHKLRKTFYPFPGSHQDTGTGVCQKMKNKRQKNCGGKYRPFL